MISNSQIASKLGTLAERFRDRFGFDLWSTPPVTEIFGIGRPVNSEDELNLRVLSLGAIFEALNKAGFDKKSGVKEKIQDFEFCGIARNIVTIS